MKISFRTVFLFILLLTSRFLEAQMGLGVTPPRNYYTSAAGVPTANKVTISNSSKNVPLVLTVSLSDWKYDINGSNVMGKAGEFSNSCAPWVQVKPQSYFTLAPGESKEIEVTVTPPARTADSPDVHTAMLFITQTNPVDSYNDNGALVKVSMQSGIKLYHRYNTPANPSIEFTEYRFNKETKNLELALENNGNIWTDGTVATELVNLNTGTKHKLEDQIIYTLPADKRKVTVALPKGLKPGKYTASSVISYGDDDTIKMAELAFVYE